MAKLAISELTTFRWSFDEDVNAYRSAGIDAIGVWRQKLSDFGEEKGSELLHETGLTVSSLSWAGGFTGSDGRSYKDSLDDARDAIRLAASLRAGCLIVHSGSRAGHTHNHARRLLKNALSELLPMAADHGVTLALEPMHRGCGGDWTFLTDIQEAVTFIETLKSSWLKLVFDTYHMADDHVLERLPDLTPHIALVHLGDSKQKPQGEPNRCPLGDGLIPLWEFISALESSGFHGHYEVELMGEEIEATDYCQLIQQSKVFFEKTLSERVM